MRRTTRTLTSRASVNPRGTLCVWAARPAVERLAAIGVPADAVLRGAGLARDALESVENRLPFENVMRLWELATDEAQDPSFGLHAAEWLPAGEMDLFEYLGSSSATAGEALHRVAAYVRIFFDQPDLRLVREPAHARLMRRGPAPAAQLDEFLATLILVRSRSSCSTPWIPEAMDFEHERPDDGELRRVFRCPVRLGAPHTEMRFARSVLELPHPRSDSRLLAVLKRYADSLLASVPSRGDDVARASFAIAQQISRGAPSLEGTAAALHVPERTLQRRLAENGTSHSDLVDDVRRDLALKYIGDAALSIGEIGYMLQFSDPTAFHRAFRRWTGCTPTEYRRRLYTPPTRG